MIRKCNNCGQCCNKSPCVISLVLVKGAERNNPCPALENHNNKALCGLYLQPEHYFNKYWQNNISDPSIVRFFQNEVIPNIPKTISKAFTSYCDNSFGTGKEDLRIPVFYK